MAVPSCWGGIVSTTHIPPSLAVLRSSFWISSCKPWQTHSVSPESDFSLWYSQLIHFACLPQLSLLTGSLLNINNDISWLQNELLTLPWPHPLHSSCLSILAITQLTQYKLSHENEDLHKSISHSTEATLLPFYTQTELSSSIIKALLYLAKALVIHSQKFKQPSDLKHAMRYIWYL